MTMISRLGFMPNRSTTIKSELICKSSEITIIIPVKNNQKGICIFINEFFKTHSFENFPKEIIIVDNNSDSEIKIKNNNYPIPILILKCSKIGPASARNLGVKNAQTEWILFTDSDCVPTESFINGYLKIQNGSVGYAGNVKAHGQDILSKYYEQQEILIPPKVYDQPNESRPDYLITANCLIWRKAFEQIGGFNEHIKIAGGEDIDLGFRLLKIGQLSYALDSIVKHNFGNGLFEFKERFKRYGYGNKIISHLYDLDLKPMKFKPNKRSLINSILAFMQYTWLASGYKNKVTL